MCFVTSFIIKVIALLTMTIDHIGLFLSMSYSYNSDVLAVSRIFRGIGRLALPLFVFMIVEGVLHTKNIKKYIARLGIMAAVISIFYLFLDYIPELHKLAYSNGFDFRMGNIFIDLTLVAISVYCLKSDKIYIKFLTLLPIAYSALSFVVKGIEHSQVIDILWFPSFLTLQYDYFSVVLGILFYAAYLLADLYIKALESTSGMDKSIWVENGNYRLLVNILSAFLLAAISVLYYLTTKYWPSAVFWDANPQLIAIFSGALILFYNGKRGYNAKWFQYGSYLYYPLHIILIFVMYITISGGL
jgi:hypothetical protein